MAEELDRGIADADADQGRVVAVADVIADFDRTIAEMINDESDHPKRHSGAKTNGHLKS